MTDIAEIERRIMAALERIDYRLSAPRRPQGTGAGPDQAEVAELRAALEAERATSADLHERLAQAKRRADVRVRRLEAELEDATTRLEDAEAGLRRMRAASESLRATSAALREGSGAEAEHVNGAMRAELEALRAERAAEREEIDAILAELAPLVARPEGGQMQDDRGEGAH